MVKSKTRIVTLTGVFTALILVFTAFIHIPSFNGYVHIGDAFLYLAAGLLPTPFAVFAGAFGAAMSDFITGYAIWAPASLVIKAVTVLCFTANEKKLLTRRNILALIPSAVLCIGGYYLYEGIIYGNFLSPVYGILGNFLQAAFSSAVFILVGLTLDRIGVKERLSIL